MTYLKTSLTGTMLSTTHSRLHSNSVLGKSSERKLVSRALIQEGDSTTFSLALAGWFRNLFGVHSPYVKRETLKQESTAEAPTHPLNPVLKSDKRKAFFLTFP